MRFPICSVAQALALRSCYHSCAQLPALLALACLDDSNASEWPVETSRRAGPVRRAGHGT